MISSKKPNLMDNMLRPEENKRPIHTNWDELTYYHTKAALSPQGIKINGYSRDAQSWSSRAAVLQVLDVSLLQRT